MNFPVNWGHAMLLKGKYPKAPLHILEAIADYAANRTVHGQFVTAVLENDLAEAVFRADNNSLAGLADIVRYVHWEIPHNSHGSKTKVKAWLNEVETDTECGCIKGIQVCDYHFSFNSNHKEE